MAIAMEDTRMRLSTENVKQVLTTCLTRNIPDFTQNPIAITETIEVRGIVNSFTFDQQMLVKEKHHIEELLEDLPAVFKEGCSFMEMYTNRDGEQWTGVIKPLEELLALGIAVGKISFLVPREQWWSLSGGMPYIVIK